MSFFERRVKPEIDIRIADLKDKLIPKEARRKLEAACIDVAERTVQVLDENFDEITGKIGLSPNQRGRLRRVLNQIDEKVDYKSCQCVGNDFATSFIFLDNEHSCFMSSSVIKSTREPKLVRISQVGILRFSRIKLDTPEAVRQKLFEGRNKDRYSDEVEINVGPGWVSVVREAGDLTVTHNIREIGTMDFGEKGDYFVYGEREQDIGQQRKLPVRDVVLEKIRSRK